MGVTASVVDYRQLNKVSLIDAYPLPFVSVTLDKLSDTRFLTTLDIKSACWQIPVSEASRTLTAFVVPSRGLFQFKRMPFGLHNAPARWQRLIDRVIAVGIQKYVFVYLGDIFICTSTFKLQLEILEKVLHRLAKTKYVCKPKLRYLCCELFRTDG